MRKEMKEIKIYKLEELKKEVKAKVIERFGEHLVERNFEIFQEEAGEILSSEYKMKDYQIEYSLSYSQGDGLCFYNENKSLLSYNIIKNKDIENANVFEKYCIEQLNNEQYLLLLEYLNCDYNFKIKKGWSNYSHAYTCLIDYEFYWSDNAEEEKRINDFIDELNEILFEKVYVKTCKKLEIIGYNCYNVSDEEVTDFIEDMDYEFLEDGSIY